MNCHNNTYHIIPEFGSSRPDINLAKYTTHVRFDIQSFQDPSEALNLPPSGQSSETNKAFQQFLNASLARGTWAKYQSGYKTFREFETAHQMKPTWPVSQQTIRAFAAWCCSTRKLSPNSTRSYIAAVKFVHSLKGIKAPDFYADPILNAILKGATKVKNATNPRSSTRRIITIPLLLTIGHRIANSDWSDMSKQVLWTAATTAFFTSARLGELLAPQETAHDPTSTLLWSDVAESSKESFLLRLKQPKSGEPCEFLDVFPFEDFQCCPVAALRTLKQMKIENGTFQTDSPVFSFGSGTNLTKEKFNTLLSQLLEDLKKPGNTISAHSFRAGIPSLAGHFPRSGNK